ncbi:MULTISPECIES: DUF4838 domain-containing protein [unclassified Streptomyces]|uniref:DUF4838 domain-containing protein n=1 Tax=unclassified Streptomyces TaxID=2593676 RepID=UPI00202438C4|nr:MULTISPECIES: DUF4838 domain-containing protein [unclassified Streptomyces]MCX4553360.1 DUF4838 domain-containing protein [Streptomyces sp. NBC_01500]
MSTSRGTDPGAPRNQGDRVNGTSEVRRRGFLVGAAGLAGATVLPLSAAAPATAATATTAPAGAARTLPVASGGRPAATVLWWGGDSARFAATELRDYVQRITGATLPLRAAAGSTEGAVPAGVTGLVVLRAGTGTGNTVSGNRLTEAGQELSGAPEDTFTLLGDDQDILLTGLGDRAPLYAVYALLERLGVRFFAPAFPAYEGHSEHVPRVRTLALPAVHLTDRPDWEFRRQYAEEGFSHTAQSLPPLLDWMAKNRLNTFVYPTNYLGLGVTTYDGVRTVLAREAAKRGIRIETGGHGYDSFLPPADYPQFYASGGPLFDIYNPEALDAYIAKVVAFLRARPEITVFDCWPPDVPKFQKAILDRYGKAANAESVVVNKLAQVLRDELPGVRVERIAYNSTIQPPDPDYACDPQVVVDFAPYGRNYDGSLGDPAVSANTGLAKALGAWRTSFRGSLVMYEYYRRYRWRSQPVRPVDTIAADVAFESQLGVNGIGMYSEPGDWITYEHVQSLVAALAWDNSLEADAYRDGYLQARFGASAAGSMGEYYDLTRFDPDTHTVTKLHDNYSQASAALKTAAAQAGDDSARTVIDRLRRGIEVNLADMSIGLQPAGSPELAAARAAYRTQLMSNRFNGVALPNTQAWWRGHSEDDAVPYSDTTVRQEAVDNYSCPAAGFGDPGELTLARGGAGVALTVVAQDVDFTGHTVHWTASGPDGITLTPARGSLRVRGTRSASHRVDARADASAAAGDHRITLEFRLVDGTRLTPAYVDLTVE